MGFSAVDKPFPSKQLNTAKLSKIQRTTQLPCCKRHFPVRCDLRLEPSASGNWPTKPLFSDTFLNELIWRDFYHMILMEFSAGGEGKAFKPEYDFIQWRNNEKEFECWCTGMTGYPIVDAGMRELNETGFMHNRVRMIVASFLTKHLLIDWRWGEAWFAQKLLDFDFAANNGGWQWAAAAVAMRPPISAYSAPAGKRKILTST